MRKEREFALICRKIGTNKQLAQAGGGNISLKLDSKSMLVKSSGISLAEVTKSKGYCKINFVKILDYLSSIKDSSFSIAAEKEYNRMLQQSLENSENSISRPSIETGFHAVLSKSVIHTHPVLVNALLCSSNGGKIIMNLLKQYNPIWVEYKTPGIELSKEIFDIINNEENRQSYVILLENHGLIVSGDELRDCLNVTDKIISLVKDYLDKNKISLPEYENLDYSSGEFSSNIVKEFMKVAGNKELVRKHMFPDSAVYCSAGFSFDEHDKDKITLYSSGRVSLPENSAINCKYMGGVLTAWLYILLVIRQFSKPKCLSEMECNNIKSMESEKYRQRLK
ncbi:class II aldolase/adducin family protein [Candidatus Woesearchaeota archaeon]|nr:class II aldolase/adducin family protein [Candidatus Woesearchaeota archaeon]